VRNAAAANDDDDHLLPWSVVETAAETLVL
jgi:hypothetical protein